MRIVEAREGKSRKTLVVQAYELLREKIITLEFSPGMRLEEQLLMEKLKLGRTPVREAVKMLIPEGLIVNHGPNATYVKDLTLKSAKDLLLLLYHLGDVIFGLADPDDDFEKRIQCLETVYKGMEEALQEGTIPTFARLNADFHMKMAEVAKNDYLDDLLERLYCEEVRLAYVLSLSLGAVKMPLFWEYYEKIQEQHRQLILLLEAKDFDRLKKAYREHLAFGQKRLGLYFTGVVGQRKGITKLKE